MHAEVLIIYNNIMCNKFHIADTHGWQNLGWIEICQEKWHPKMRGDSVGWPKLGKSIRTGHCYCMVAKGGLETSSFSQNGSNLSRVGWVSLGLFPAIFIA